MTKVLLTGTSGAMGSEAIKSIVASGIADKIRVLLRDKPSNRRLAKKFRKQDIEVIFGDLANYEDCLKSVKDMDYVLHMAAIISPIADHNKQNTHNSNFVGTKNLVDSIIELGQHTKFVHTSTVAVYGGRNYLAPWGRVGDPLMPSAYDCYAMSKLMAERYVIDSELENWVVIRQTAVLHNKLFTNNLGDGLMYHTNLNGPLEWVTAHDSGVLMEHLVEYDAEGKLDSDFWRKCYNIGGGDTCRVTGYQTLNDGFGLCGAKLEQLFKPNWSAIRNFHGIWFTDSDKLEDYLHFRSESFDDYWKQMAKRYWYFAFGRLVPKKLISKLVLEPLTHDTNAPRYWVEHNIEGRVNAFFGGREEYDKIGDWDTFPLLVHGKTPEGDIDYNALKDINNSDKYKLNHGFDETKPVCELDINDMIAAATFRGGKLISTTMQKGDMYTKLEWECSEGHRFFASPYAVLFAGHWCNECCLKYHWNWDKLARNNPFFAQVHYNMFGKDELREYPYSEHEDDFIIKD